MKTLWITCVQSEFYKNGKKLSEQTVFRPGSHDNNYPWTTQYMFFGLTGVFFIDIIQMQIQN